MNAALTRPVSLQRCLVAGLIVSILATACMGVALAFGNPTDEDAALLIGTPATLALCFGLMVTFSAVIRRKPSLLIRAAMIFGAFVTGAATVVSLALLVISPHGDEELENPGMAASIAFALAIALAYTGALSLVRTRSWLIRAMAIGTGVSAWAASALVVTNMLIMEDLINSQNYSAMMVLSVMVLIAIVLTVIGTIAVPIAVVSKAGKRREAVESIDPRVQVHFGCPNCGERQTHRPGFIRCAKCGAGMFIEIEEPRCECGYLLYKLTGDACPECGRQVVAAADASA